MGDDQLRGGGDPYAPESGAHHPLEVDGHYPERVDRRRIFIPILITALLAGAAAFGAGFAVGQNRERAILGSVEGGASGSKAIQRAYNNIISKAVSAPSADKIAQGAIKGMVEVLKKAEDPYASYFSPQGYESFTQLSTGGFSGIGVVLRQEKRGLRIESVLEETPAAGVGLKEKDLITTIDGKNVTRMNGDLAIARIRGPEGTTVDLEVLRRGKVYPYSIERAQIELPNLESKLRADDLGYVRLYGFARGAGDQLREEVQQLTDEGATGIILDLRDNGGGLFDEGIEVASAFIEDGVVVSYKEKNAEPVEQEAVGDAFEEIPLVVLVNGGTASASEIVAGALQDRGRAQLVGETTFGKGVVQQVIELDGASGGTSALKFTTAAYFTPSGRDINGKGIEPDVEVDGSAASQLRRAAEVLQQAVASAPAG